MDARRVDELDAYRAGYIAAQEESFDDGWSKGKAWGEKQERTRLAERVRALSPQMFDYDGSQYSDPEGEFLIRRDVLALFLEEVDA